MSPVKVQEPTCHVNSVLHPPSPHSASPKREPAAVDLERCDITIAEKHKVKLLLEEYRDVFANSYDEVGRTHRTQFHMHTKNQVPVAVKLRRTPLALRNEVNQQIKDMEIRGIIEPSSSPLLSTYSTGTQSRRFLSFLRGLSSFKQCNAFGSVPSTVSKGMS